MNCSTSRFSCHWSANFGPVKASNSESRKVGKWESMFPLKPLQQALGAENVDRLLATWQMIFSFCDIEHIIWEVSIGLP